MKEKMMYNRYRLMILIVGAFIFFVFGYWSMPLNAQNTEVENSGLVSNVYSNNLQDGNKKIPLASLLHRIERNFNVTFLYEQHHVINKRVDSTQIEIGEGTGRELSEVLNELGFTYHQIDDETFVIVPKKDPAHADVFQEQISGRVFDEQTGEALPGVNILITGTEIGTTTDVDGNFELSVPSLDVTLRFSYIGYQTQEILLEGQTELRVDLVSETIAGEELVVIGYGERQRGDITGSISSVSSEKLERGSSVSPELALQGRTPGVQISNVSGNPLQRPNIRIRGITTFGVADPLIVIDGVPITEFGSGAEGGFAANADLRGNVNIMSMINPGDIESISVLKDASSAAIYGVRGANGVILITTKGGREGKPQIQIDAQRGIQNVSQLDVLNVRQYTDLYQEAYANNPDQAGNLPSVFDPSSADYLGDMPSVNWQNELINQDAITEDYGARVSGGTESIRYFVSGGYSNTEGTIRGNQLERYSFAGNLNATVSERVRVGATYRLGYVEALDNRRGASLNEGYLAPPWQPIYDPDGSFYDEQTYAATQGFAPSTTLSGERLWGPQSRANSLGRQDLSRTGYELVRNIGSAFIEIEPIRNLSFRGSLNGDWYRNLRTDFTDMDDHWFNVTAAGPDPNLAEGSIGSYRERNGTNRNVTGEFRTNYVNNFDNHNIDILGNVSWQKYGIRGLNALGQFVPIRDRDQWAVTRTAEPGDTEGFNWVQEDALIGILGRLSYNFDNRYYIDFTIRRDGTSRFAPGYKWGTFPAVSGSWRISSESFMDRFAFISDLKIRGGWGQLGNQETSRFAYISGVSDSPTYSVGAGGEDVFGTVRRSAALPDFPTEDLSWETVITTNIAVDALLFDDRLSVTAEFYNRVTDGILQTVPIAPSVGNQNDPTINVAEILNRGIELDLGYRNALGPVQYDLSANLTTVHNEVLSLFGGTPFTVTLNDEGDQGRVEEGESLFFFRGYQMEGIFQNQSEVDAWQADFEEPGSLKAPGDIYYKDINGDGVIDADDRSKIGSPIPDYYYGFNIDLFYKGFDLSLFFQGVGGIQRVNNVRLGGEAMSSDGVNQLTSVLDRWTPENPSESMPRAVRDDPGNNNRFSDRWVEDADYIRLRNMQLGYTLPPELVNRMGMGSSSLRLFLSGINLITITGWSGLDPEDDIIPPARTISLGINMTIL